MMLVWALGGGYALLGAISTSELGAALPEAGGFYVYSKRAFGPAAGFAMGWADWLNNCAGLAYVSVTAAEYLLLLMPQSGGHLAYRQTGVALGLLGIFCLLQWHGLRLSSRVQRLASSITAITFLTLVVACLLHSGQVSAVSVTGAAAATSTTQSYGPGKLLPSFVRLLVPIFAVLPGIVVAYDGWYEAIYFTEEDTNAAKHLPRAMIGGVVLIIGLYLLMNLAFLHVLTIPQLGSSHLAATDAARMVFPAWSGTFVTVLSLLTLLSFMNAVFLGAPRILFAVGRDGLFSGAAQVGPEGTPHIALLVTAAMVVIFILSGKFEEIIGIAAILMAVEYCVNYVALFVLRIREPQLSRPFRAWGYPWSTALVLTGSLLFLIVGRSE